MSDYVLLPHAFPKDAESVLQEAISLGPKVGPRFLNDNLPFGCQVALAFKNQIEVDVRAAHLALCTQLYNLLAARHGKVKRVAASEASTRTTRQLDYSSLSPSEGAVMRAEPKSAKPASLAAFCLHNNINTFFCISTADLALVVRRAQLKENNRERQEAEEQQAREAKRAKGLLARIFQWVRGGTRAEH
ncbi:uncharacterized protein LOC132205500 isoform X2 [Neocloeon triangulifer]|nr:uncharacterized protein LOC132205500 isoform X2 [Neocloeon triangulifer]XP_059490565.1 uncharacterized protein LOC132205500 isoform X2 [Neocloeon triangulifer]